jgi:3-oxoacyl-[acyl-carrier protein] reductase
MIDLTGRVAVVTGGSRGIGRAIVVCLAQQGADVAFSYLSNEAAARETCAEVEALGRRALTVRADVARPEDSVRLIDETLSAFGRLDILVNNAGLTGDHLIAFMTPEAWHQVLDTNLSGAFYMTRAALRPMLRARTGHNVNISSISGQLGNQAQANYAASKAGLIGLTEVTAREAGSRGITCNAVAPGLVATDLTDELSEARRDAIVEHAALGRASTPAEIAAAVAFLVSDEARSITGQTLTVDGGMSFM